MILLLLLFFWLLHFVFYLSSFSECNLLQLRVTRMKKPKKKKKKKNHTTRPPGQLVTKGSKYAIT
jgi:hypothetical protein